MRKSLRIILFGALLAFWASIFLHGELQFEKSEYAARRAKLMEAIPDGIAVLLGAQPVTGYYEFFQNNDFMYFCGVDAPGAALIIDGVAKESLLFLTLTERQARGENLSLELVESPTDFTGIERHYPIERFTATLARLAERRKVIYTPFKPEELMREVSNEKFNTLKNIQMFNEWDGRLTRELQFVKLLGERFPQAAIRDCSPDIWDLRVIKSPAEIEVIRRAGRIGVKALNEMVRATRAGVFEYEIAALYEYMCKKEGVRDLAYMPIISSEENHPYLHYHKHNRLLGDGDFLVVDAGPDVGHYDVD
ncbi:MAG: aminopeptidase P N-terminal domain-containing protein, partial [Candidatus Aminicenantaceae bacterium]